MIDLLTRLCATLVLLCVASASCTSARRPLLVEQEPDRVDEWMFIARQEEGAYLLGAPAHCGFTVVESRIALMVCRRKPDGGVR